MIKMVTTITLLALFLQLQAPSAQSIAILQPEEINPYEAIWKATIMVESSGNPLAYHMEDNGKPSIGIAQIQESRLNDFNRRFRQSFTLNDMYLPNKAKIVFMAYASDFRPHDNESISRCWNGGSKGMEKKSTQNYWKKIKRSL